MAKTWLGRIAERVTKAFRVLVGPTEVPNEVIEEVVEQVTEVKSVPEEFPPYVPIREVEDDEDDEPLEDYRKLIDVVVPKSALRRAFDTAAEAEAYAATIPVKSEVLQDFDGYRVVVWYEVVSE